VLALQQGVYFFIKHWLLMQKKLWARRMLTKKIIWWLPFSGLIAFFILFPLKKSSPLISAHGPQKGLLPL